MSQRRTRPKNLQDRFDSEDHGTYDDLPTLRQIPVQSPTIQHVPNLNIFEAIEVMSVLLKDYQSKHKHIDGADEWSFWFPFAWITLEKDDEIKNLSTNEIYRVDELIQTRDHRLKNYVRLKGVNPPKSWHVMRLDDKKSKAVSIIPAYPDTEVKPYNFGPEGHEQGGDAGPEWKDVITYSIMREAPGSRDRHPFGTNQELTPRFRETVDNQEIYNQMIDTEVRFDFWTESNGDSEKMREWFRDFSHKYRWLLQQNGVAQFFWWLSFTAINATRWRPGIVHRSASYFFRTEYSISKDLFTIRDIDVTVNVPNSQTGENGEQININI
jgi:hypothetical protein